MGSPSSERYSSSPERKTMCLPLAAWPGALGSESSTIGNTTMMIVTSTMAPIRRRRARRLSCSSSSLIARAICRR
ncbi:hypothetical protein D3C83_48930 [compost metagenome]